MAPLGGLRLIVQALCRELRAEVDVRVLCLDGPRDQEPPDWVRSVPLPVSRRGDMGAWGRFLLRGRPLRDDRWVAALSTPTRRALQDFDPDVVHVLSGRLAGLHAHLDDRPRILTGPDATHLNLRAAARNAPVLRRAALLLEARRSRALVASSHAPWDATVWVTEEDAREIAGLSDRIRTCVIGNGVDLPRESVTATAENSIAFHGTMSYPPNIDAAVFAATQVLPRVRRTHPDVRLQIVGRRPTPRVLELAQLPGVDVVGEVDEVAPWLGRSRAYLCPMRMGSGIKNKLLEAMAVGLPCVVTPLALQGIDVEDGTHVLVGRDPSELADRLVAILDDPGRAASLGAHGRDHVANNHSWASIARAYRDLYEDVMATRA